MLVRSREKTLLGLHQTPTRPLTETTDDELDREAVDRQRQRTVLIFHFRKFANASCFPPNCERDGVELWMAADDVLCSKT